MDNYEVLKKVAEGTYGAVFKCRHKDGRLVAIKRFKYPDSDPHIKKTASREIRLLKRLRHNNVVHLYEVFRRKGRFCLVFEYVDRTLIDDIDAHPNGIEPELARRVIWQTLLAIDYCHANNVIHRDIKPENLLLTKNGVLKLCDFGFARVLSGPDAHYTDYVATRWYRSPELLVGDDYGPGVDVWALGCLVAELHTGDPLFAGDTDIDQLYHIVKCLGRLPSKVEEVFHRNPIFNGVTLPEVDKPVPLERRFPRMPIEAFAFMKDCLAYDPADRKSSAELLLHPYLRRHTSRLEKWMEEALWKDEEEAAWAAKAMREKMRAQKGSGSSGSGGSGASNSRGGGGGGGGGGGRRNDELAELQRNYKEPRLTEEEQAQVRMDHMRGGGGGGGGGIGGGEGVGGSPPPISTSVQLQQQQQQQQQDARERRDTRYEGAETSGARGNNNDNNTTTNTSSNSNNNNGGYGGRAFDPTQSMIVSSTSLANVSSTGRSKGSRNGGGGGGGGDGGESGVADSNMNSMSRSLHHVHPTTSEVGEAGAPPDATTTTTTTTAAATTSTADEGGTATSHTSSRVSPHTTTNTSPPPGPSESERGVGSERRRARGGNEAEALNIDSLRIRGDGGGGGGGGGGGVSHEQQHYHHDNANEPLSPRSPPAYVPLHMGAATIQGPDSFRLPSLRKVGGAGGGGGGGGGGVSGTPAVDGGVGSSNAGGGGGGGGFSRMRGPIRVGGGGHHAQLHPIAGSTPAVGGSRAAEFPALSQSTPRGGGGGGGGGHERDRTLRSNKGRRGGGGTNAARGGDNTAATTTNNGSTTPRTLATVTPSFEQATYSHGLGYEGGGGGSSRGGPYEPVLPAGPRLTSSVSVAMKGSRHSLVAGGGYKGHPYPYRDARRVGGRLHA